MKDKEKLGARDAILNMLKDKERSPGEIFKSLSFSRQMIHHVLAQMLDERKVIKLGKAPKVFYRLNHDFEKNIKIVKESNFTFLSEISKYIEDNYLYISASGEYEYGIHGFIAWCRAKNEKDIEKAAKEYVKTMHKYDAYKKHGLIDATQKATDTFGKSESAQSPTVNIALKKMYYVDFYAVERFGKTKLGNQLFYGKQSGDRKLISIISDEIKSKIEYLIERYDIEAIAFVPPTIKRDIQLMKVIEYNLNLKSPTINIVKVSGELIVPQKSLSKIKDRIYNAEHTFVIDDNHQYKNVLLIDDAVGSGATFEVLAKKIKQQGLASNVYAVAVVGSWKGFDVISEV